MITFTPFRFGRTEIITLSVLLGLATLVIAIATVPAIAGWYTRMTTAWTDWALRYGYFGAFLAALVGNLTVVIVFPYTVISFFLATSGLDPIALGILTGVGAFLGESSGYVLGRWGSGIFRRAKPAEFEALRRILDARPRMIQVLLFAFSTLPLPDDVLFIPLGMLRYSYWKLLLPALIGKIIAGLVITTSGSALVGTLDASNVTSPAAIAGQIGTLVLVVLVMYAIVKIDWTRMMHRLLDDRA